MGIKMVTGDILSPNDTDKITVICHQVNCKGVMGSGLAKQVREKYPQVFEEYKKKCHDYGSMNLGDCQWLFVGHSRFIANIFGQDSYGRDRCYTDYVALHKAFDSLYKLTGSNVVVRIPYKIGCGLGGGNWNVVQDMINKCLVDKGVEVEIWELP